MASTLTIREARPEEFAALGELLVNCYASLPGMPTVEEQPDYYGRLREVSKRVASPGLRIYVATDPSGALLGCVDFIADMKHYASGGSASSVPDAAGIRLLAVDPARRGGGVGKELTGFCIDRARELGRSQVVLHTTRAMQTAWGMYERLGFVRFPEIDFRQGDLEVFGFRLPLSAR
jgi:ribosomal protein S18 acetylase RimI-like enzyme